MHGRTERRTAGGRTQRHSAPERSTGRHRGPGGRLPGPVGLATAVTLLLVMLGVGAAVMPIGLAGSPDAAPPAPDGVTTSEPAGIGILGEAPTPSATPSSARPSPSVKPTVAPSRPTPSRTPSRAPKVASSADSREEQVVEIVNQERTANGCASVSINDELAEAARLHSEDQAVHDKMSHDGSDGSSFVDRAREAGYASPIGENVAMGYATPGAVMDGWMNSQGHRANILNCDAKAIGVGIAANSAGRLYWTQVFGAVV